MPDYRTRCLLLGLQSLVHRRKVAQSVFVAKLLKHEIDAPKMQKNIPIYPKCRTDRKFGVQERSKNYFKAMVPRPR